MIKEGGWIHGGHILRSVREKKGLTQDEVCLMSNIDRRTYQRWERKQSEPSFGQTMQICECAFKVDLLDAVAIAVETPEQ
ncbi:helix-turn-helix domain-containing protein [Arsukibacterium sp.]|uniref:helix-turn-helix domain-containing protein n=1 Tax=Arsukibacterium sp. TaxID=1977258 RepID=UPI0039A5EB12